MNCKSWCGYGKDSGLKELLFELQPHTSILPRGHHVLHCSRHSPVYPCLPARDCSWCWTEFQYRRNFQLQCCLHRDSAPPYVLCNNQYLCLLCMALRVKPHVLGPVGVFDTLQQSQNTPLIAHSRVLHECQPCSIVSIIIELYVDFIYWFTIMLTQYSKTSCYDCSTWT